MHFGAFLEDRWRRNEHAVWAVSTVRSVLIRSLLPQNCPKLCAALIEDAQLRILTEYYTPMNSKGLLDYSSEAVGRLGPPDSETAKLQEFFYAGEGTPGANILHQLVLSAVRQSLTPDKVLDYFRRPDGYEVSMEPTPTTSASALARGTTVIGKMLKKSVTTFKCLPPRK